MSKIQIRDRRGGSRYFIDNTFLRGGWGKLLKAHGIAVYNALCLHAGVDDQRSWPSVATIADMLGMSSRQVQREVAKLASYNLILIHSSFRDNGAQSSNIYDLLHHEHWRLTPYDSQSPPPTTHSHPPYDSQSPHEQNPLNKTHGNKGGLDYLDSIAGTDPDQLTPEIADPLEDFHEFFSKYSSEGPEIWYNETGKRPDKGKALALREIAQQPHFDPGSFSDFLHEFNIHGGYMYDIARIGQDYKAYTQGNWSPKNSTTDEETSLKF